LWGWLQRRVFRLDERDPMLGRRGNTPMGARAARVLLATAACLLWLNGCETSTRLGDLFQSTAETGAATQDDPITTGSVRPPPRDTPAAAKAAPDDELKLGKKYFQAGNFDLAERHFRRAVELHPRDLESWIGLAASYDRQRRFDLADRAYDQATKIAGPTAEILNNRGYSYMLRGDARRARETLLEAQARDPGNTYIKNNLETVEASLRKSKATQ
jgi:Flp pilus assembly protein TadD